MSSIAVDVAYFELGRQRSRLAELRAMLSPEEIARAERLAIPAVRERFILRHGILRETLAHLCGVPPAALRFVSGKDGKPSLADGGGPHFNLSKAGDGLLIATADGAAVGCDLEMLRPNAEAAGIAARWFGPGEREALARIEGAARNRAFLRLWVRKEALLKVAGTGLQGSLAMDTGSLDHSEACRPVVVGDGTHWLADVEVADGSVAAVAADRPMALRFAVHG